MRRAIYPGTFDPLTIGHVDIIKRCLKLFDEITVLIAENSGKNAFYSAKERVEMIKEVLSEFPNVKVDYYDGLVVDYARKNDAKFLIRGLRAVQDYESELIMAYGNKFLDQSIETIYLMADISYSFVSSSTVKEIALYSDRYKELVPKVIAEKYEKILKSKR